MKTILIPTDFSANAAHAAAYGYNLAKQIKANIILCNAVIVPAEVPQAGFVTWPMDEYETLIDESSSGLRLLKNRLEEADASLTFKPSIAMMNKPGTVSETVSSITIAHGVDMVVIGQHSRNGLNTFMLGNHAQKLIDEAIKPVLLVPREAPVKQINKIAFATDFKQPKQDLEYIYELISFARLFNAEVLLTHVYRDKSESADFQVWVKRFIDELSNKANYPLIYYRLINNDKAENGLDWLCEQGNVDILAMVHRRHNFLNNLVPGSHTQRMADHISIPLLVFPSKS